MTPTLLGEYIIYAGAALWWVFMTFIVTLYLMGVFDKENKQ